jgi:hypothetical protein
MLSECGFMQYLLQVNFKQGRTCFMRKFEGCWKIDPIFVDTGKGSSTWWLEGVGQGFDLRLEIKKISLVNST